MLLGFASALVHVLAEERYPYLQLRYDAAGKGVYLHGMCMQGYGSHCQAP